MYYNDISCIPFSSSLHLAVGSFDGLHLGHKALIERAISSSKQKKQRSLILSFEPLPKEFLNSSNFLGRLLPPEIKISKLSNFCADDLIILPFESIQKLSEKELIESILKKTEQIYLYCGKDFRMGNPGKEKYFGEKLQIISCPELHVENRICRSSSIRKLIKSANLDKANKLLGYEYTIYSYTQHGNGIGKSIDFPTINAVITNQVIPQKGSYFGELQIFGNTYPSMIYVGTKPTIAGVSLCIESNILMAFPHTRLPEGSPVAISFIKKIAEEKTFDSLADLRKMLYNYRAICLDLNWERQKNKVMR